MRPINSLRPQLQGLNGKGYGAYQSIRGSYAYDRFELHIDQIPKDPYAPPNTGVFRARVSRDEASFPDNMSSSGVRNVALRDYLARQFHKSCSKICPGRRGTGNSGVITIAKPGQEILERTSIVINSEWVEARFFLGFPASGRTIQAGTAETMLFQELPRIVQSSLLAENLDLETVREHLRTAEDAEFLRESLRRLGLVAFVADGAILPRESGVDPKPLKSGTVVAFHSPASLRLSIDLPNAGTLTGMGIPKGVTLIVGGGYHGKSTLLQALELGIYNHIPGDGREYCVSLPGTVKVRAASGRSVVRTDISAFINNVPLQQTTTSFSTKNASGSTSQAAFIVEAMEAGAEVLLMDEDTCAANFMIRDRRMQQLVAKKHEPITAFVDKVTQLYEERGISTILVMGGSGDYFGAADFVIQMIEFEPHDVTQRAHAIAQDSPASRTPEGGSGFEPPTERMPIAEHLDPHNEYGHFRISAPDPRHLIFGQIAVDLSDVEQLTDAAQTKAIGRAINYAKKVMDGRTKLWEVINHAMDDLKRDGLDLLDPSFTGDLAQFRGLDLAAVLNRMRGLEARQARWSLAEPEL